MNKHTLILVFAIVAGWVFYPRFSYSAPPVRLWHKDIRVTEACIPGNGLTVAGYRRCAYGSPCEFDPGIFFLLDAATGNTLWQITTNVDKVPHSFFITNDGQKIVFSEILQTPQEYKEVAYWADAIGPYITRVFNRDGTLFSQMSGGAGSYSPSLRAH